MDNGEQNHFLNAGGKLGELTREYPWHTTSLGPIDQWPENLKTTVGIMLRTDFPMFLWWGEEMIQFYNDGYRPSLGNDGKHPKALGQKGVDCWPEIWDVIFPLINQVRTTGKSFFSENQLVPIYRNGRIEDVYWTFSYSAVVGINGNVDGVLVVCNETTGYVQTLKELERSKARAFQSENNLKNIFRQAPVAMCIFKGPDFVVELANDRMFEFWGKPAREFIDRPLFDGLPEARNQGFEELLTKVYTTGETITAYGVPIRLPRNGSVELVYVQFVYEPFRDQDDKITGVMAVAVEVTDQVKAAAAREKNEDEIRSIIEGASFPIGVYVGRDMRIKFVNKAIRDVWGKGDQGLIGNSYFSVLPELETQEIYQQLDAVFMTGDPFHARNQRIDLVVDGKMRSSYFNYSFTPLRDPEGSIYGVLNTAADVTDMNIAKLQVEQSERNFRNMVKHSPVAMCIMLGPDHVVEVANDSILELWGKSENQILKKPIFEGLPDARGQGLEELLDTVYRDGKAFNANERPVVLLRNGKEETVYQNFVYEPYRDSNENVIGVLAITIDVTPQVVARLKIEDVVKERTESLRKSNEELSRFAYVASHDLQEPVRKISVFVELLGKTLGTVDNRSKGYLDKIDSSANRMLALIRGILELSRLSDAGAKFEAVDLNKIIGDIRSEFELLIEEKNCTIESDPLPSLQAIPIQMSQLFGNLISNSLKFSTPGLPLQIRISCEALNDREREKISELAKDTAYWRIVFSDNGIGFGQENASSIFEVFRRLHSTLEYKGTGIGLATAKKIVENHHGHIYAESTKGKGAMFTVILPMS